MRINIFTAPAIGVHLCKVKDTKGGGKKVEDCLRGIQNELGDKFEKTEEFYCKTKSGTKEEFGAIYSHCCIASSFVALDIIDFILYIDDGIRCWKKMIEKESKK